MEENIQQKPAKSTFSDKRKKELLFYIAIMAFPVVQVIIFYFVVNFNSVLLAFKKYTVNTNGMVVSYVWEGFDNFSLVFYDLTHEFALISAFKNSMIAFGVQMLICTPLAVLFSYYIFQKRVGSGLFRIFLFLPSVISPSVIVVMYKVMLEEGLPDLFLKIFGLEIPRLYSNNTMFYLLFYFVWTSFGTNVLLYTSAMTSIDESVLEAAKLDGAIGGKGFIYIIFPLIYPTFLTFVTVNVATVFTNQLNLFAFENLQAQKQYYTFGYYLYRETALTGNLGKYPYLSAMGIVMTVIATPITLILRHCMLKYGPSED